MRFGIEFDGNGRIVVSSIFEGTIDFDATQGVDEHTSNGRMDAFVSLWTVDGDYLWTHTIGGRGEEYAKAVFDLDGGILISGRFQKRVDFDPGQGVDERRTGGQTDAFLSRWTPDGDY